MFLDPCAQGGASFGGSDRTDKSQASSFLRALVLDETGLIFQVLAAEKPGRVGIGTGAGKGRGYMEQDFSFNNIESFNKHYYFLCARD